MQKFFYHLVAASNSRLSFMRGFSLVVPVAMLAVLLLAACGDNTNTTTPTAGLAVSTPPPSSQAATGTPVPPTPQETIAPNPTSTVLPPTAPPTVSNARPPGQPEKGPGGNKEYVYEGVNATNYGLSSDGYYLYEPKPAPPKDQKLPLAVFLHGYGGVDPTEYRPWIDHLVRKGAIVVFPIYQGRTDRDGEKFSDNAFGAVKAALKKLEDGKHTQPDLNKFSVVGYSAGGVIATNLAARAAQQGLPIPKAVFAVTPGGCANCSPFAIRNFTLAQPPELGAIAPDTKMLVLAGDNDNVVGETGSSKIWESTGQVRAENKNYLLVITDNHGKPALRADHGMATRNPPNAHNFYGLWKLFDALQSCSFDNKDCKYALGNTPEQRNLGQWSNGTPVVELKVLG